MYTHTIISTAIIIIVTITRKDKTHGRRGPSAEHAVQPPAIGSRENTTVVFLEIKKKKCPKDGVIFLYIIITICLRRRRLWGTNEVVPVRQREENRYYIPYSISARSRAHTHTRELDGGAGRGHDEGEKSSAGNGR